MAEDPWADFRQPTTQSGSTEDPWAEFRGTPAPTSAATAAAPSAILDVAKAAPVGLAKGIIGLPTLPNTLMQAADDFVLGPIARTIVRATGRTPTSEQGPDTRGSIADGFPSAERVQRGVETVTGSFYKPQTTAGEYAQTIGEFAPSAAIGPGGLVRKIMETAVPAVASETAGQATKGSAAEPAARLIGAIMGGVGTAAVRARADAHDRTIRAAVPRGMTEADWQASQGVADTGRRLGIDLTGSEAIQRATGGATKLADVQRFVEGSPQSAALTGMMAARPGQMHAAVGNALDSIAPQSAHPSALGSQVADAARRSIDNSPEGQALIARIMGVGPRTTAAQAGPDIQNGLRRTYEGREGVRAALADQDYAAARNAPETIGIDRKLEVERPGEPIVTQPAYARPQFEADAPRPVEPFTAPALDGSDPAGKSLARFIAENGGLRLDGDAAATDLQRFTVPGVGKVARPDGKSLDNFWRERLIEEGYFRPDADGGMARDISSELLRKLQNEQRGVPSYPMDAQGKLRGRGEVGRSRDEYDVALSTAESRLNEDLTRAGIDPASVHPDVRGRTIGAVMRGEISDPLDAYEHVVGRMKGPLEPYVKSTTVTEEIPAPLFGQANPSNVVAHIDDALRTAKGPVAEALNSARGMLFTPAGGGRARELDLSVEGLQNARAQVGAMINAAARGGDRPTAAALESVQGRLDDALATVPEHAAATRNFAAASEPLRPFDNPALAKVIERDEYGRAFTLPPERTAPAIETGGPTAVRTFNDVAPPEARAGFENYLGTKILDAATDARGAVSGDALALGMRGNADVLDTVPGLRERLLGVRRADDALEPQRSGAIGNLSRARTTEAAGDAVLPAKPRVGGERELVDLIMRTAREGPQATAQLVRQRLADQADTSMGRLVGGEAQGGGARFAKDIAGTRQQETNLDAVLGALPNSPTARQTFNDVVEVLRATGTRKPQGSPTDFNAQYRAEIGGETLPQQGLTALKTGGLSLLANARDAGRRAYLGRNNERLAETFAASDSVDRLKQIIMRRAETPYSDAALRAAIQAPGALTNR